ncbi:type I-E CRISPR-associated protein Cse1/CasA [Streptomyces sp. CBMA152]|uniref:type I-E CRISPR-associated protein Cse1/CasA n=1 Tax=Streptomyces sp. CBMA152 TaxID=1896312 RepID=UPI00166120CC|nr:type I-E CRISPR-associated protein Cse1/CasA [Streptomyces sp. CBMA152]MBD0741908.1 type I-E CRISPR-associated protein Cse1/CasA [Streptomyces sp. CBMA152]
MTDEQAARRTGDTPSFDLTSRPWLPVQLLNGRELELSLREIFDRAEEIRRLAGDMATQDFALMRLLLAILHDALNGPQDVDEWEQLWEEDAPFAVVPDYLDAHRERFDLLDEAAPFFQTAGLRTPKDEISSLNRIVADVPNGEPFFTMRARGAERISFAEAARWVVHTQTYDTSGIKTGVVGDSQAKAGKAYPQGVAWAGSVGGVLAEGMTLRETLLLNLIATSSGLAAASSEDRPAWRRKPAAPGAAPDVAQRPHGLRDLYTWQSRRLLLHADADGVHGVVLTYGDPLAPHNMHTHEPMSAWRRSEAQEKKLARPLVYMPQEHDPSRAAWRGLEALITPQSHGAVSRGDPSPKLRPGIVAWLAQLVNERVLPKGMMVRVRTYGAVYGTQQSVIDEIIEDGLAMAVVVLSESDRRLGQVAVDAAADAEEAVTVLGHLAADLAQARGSTPDAAKATVRDRGFGVLDGPYRSWLAAIREGDTPHELRTTWQHTVRREITVIATELISTAGEAAWHGRVIDHAKGQLWLNAASADLRFRVRLNERLPLAAGPASDPETDASADATQDASGPNAPKVPA